MTSVFLLPEGETLGQEYCSLMLAQEVRAATAPSSSAAHGGDQDYHHGDHQGEHEGLFLPLWSSRRAIAIIGDGALAYVAQVSPTIHVHTLHGS